MGDFPDCFPANFKESILPEQAKEQEIEVYRIMKWGKIDKKAFLSTFEEQENKLIPIRKSRDLNDPGTYSTSCFAEYEDACYVLKMLTKHYPEQFIAKGKTHGPSGLSQRTIERDKKTTFKSHIDWWIYKNADPELHFYRENDNYDKTIF